VVAVGCAGVSAMGASGLGGTVAWAQQGAMGGMAMGGGSMEGMKALPPPEQLPAPVKMTGIGNGHITIKANTEAQAWFDQGLNLLHDFWDYESAKAFEQGIRVDPKCAMCWWGLAQAEEMRGDPGTVYGKRALEEAGRLKGHASTADKLYIEASQAGEANQNADQSGAKDSGKAGQVTILRRLVAKEPKEIQPRIFLAEAVGDGYDGKGEPRAGQKERIAILEGILKDAPNDSAANHYWIHAMEPGLHPELAIASSARLASLAPASGHMVHMPGHIYYRVGDYADAEHWFAASTDADERYMREQHVGVDDDWNYVHNMMYGIANLMEEGKLTEASALSDRLAGARGELSATLYVWSARDQMSRVSRRLPVALRVGDWDAVLTMVGQAKLSDGEKTANLRFLAMELGEFATGMRALEQKDVAVAQAASDRMDAGLWRGEREQKERAEGAMKAASGIAAPGKAGPAAGAAAAKVEPAMAMAPVMPDADAGALMTSLTVASLELRAGVVAAQGKLDEAKKMYAEAEKKEKQMGYHEPPFYIRPVGETEAEALIAAKDYAGAKTAYEAALVERPKSGFELYGLARVKELSGDSSGAREGYAEFLKAWPGADAALPEVVHARAVVGEALAGVR
jgi:tetratricopeptide (TPR) repeat protein